LNKTMELHCYFTIIFNPFNNIFDVKIFIGFRLTMVKDFTIPLQLNISTEVSQKLGGKQNGHFAIKEQGHPFEWTFIQ